ncbi:MAG: J domain-containing protein [Acidimicrobiaceae bacterium]|jgi:molecular chaperone DnaJ|nr:J domain-containing protein [Acidimicrobiaceae bacterium]HAY66888.1 molecular chaperone DnaJ [Acidimicrobiaceae bacterium]
MQATAEWLDTDYYEVLGVRSDATTKQIKSAYRKLARTAHPDANPDDPTAEQRFSDIAKAYEVLSDPDRRPEYDEVRSRPRGSHFGEQGYRPEGFGHRSTSAQDFDMADLFDLFGAQAQPGQRPTTNWPLRGRDLTASLRLDFESAINGLTQSLELDGRNVKTRIPAGVQDGQTIRLAGKGGAEANGGPSGDLFIEIAVDKHPVFGRSGRNLTVTVPISYADAALGGEMRVPTLDGAFVTIKVPAGTQVGKTFRVPGRGVPHPTKPGNLLASVTITVPTSVTDENAELLRQLSA